MALRMVGLFVLMLSVAAVAHSEMMISEPDGHGLVEDAIDMDEQMMMESETARRQLGGGGYISYGALMRNKIPCDQKGQSYYNCRHHEVANPYNRGCTRVTNCARSTV
ncbi:rapid alkalinization factor 23-like [Salvia miltiorrhiza]|nr:rapid alkalinization factor 23-like [Salvia miltiorrhiza]